jgi:long-chain acyl-CoA synthetase
MNVTRVFDILPYQATHFPKVDMFSTKVDRSWVAYSTSEVINIVNHVSLGLIHLGLEKNEKVAIISFNRPEWNFIDYGVQQVGAISVPIYPTITEEDFKYILTDAEVKFIFVANAELYEKIKRASAAIGSIQKIFTFDVIEGASHWTSVKALGEKENIHRLTPYKDAVTPDDLLTLIYTSGTTGNPKGVMLTHHNLLSNVKACTPLMPIDHTHKALSFLPLCHVYERMMSYLYTSIGASIYYAESIDTISENLKEIHPNMFVTVPRLLEKVYDKIYAKGQELTGIKRMLFFWALDLGLKYEPHQKQGAWYNFQLKLANKLIFNKWREALGGDVKAIVSGGAALQPRLARVFMAAQITILEGYGLTETSPVIAVNHVEKENNMIGTVGPLIEGVEVKIAADGEILTRGPHVMKGYYNKPDLTAEAIDADGWFHTGDIGTFIHHKFLKITDRKKEIFKTSGGKYIAPQQMENKFKESVVIEQVMVCGEGEKFPVALVVPDFAQLREYCKFKEIPYTTNEDMITHLEIIQKIEKEINELNENFAQYERVKKIKLMPKLWSVESGELTPTLKLKRKNITQNNKHLIDALYENKV